MIPAYAALVSVFILGIQLVWPRRAHLAPKPPVSSASTGYLSHLKHSLQQQTLVAVLLRTLRLLSNIALLAITIVAFIQYNSSIPPEEETRGGDWQRQYLRHKARIEALAICFYVRLPR